MLQASAASWNAGDLDGYLDDYWQSDELSFSGPAGVTMGWAAVRDRYLESYWAPGAPRDSLTFEGLQVRLLGTRHALVLGRYVLSDPAQGGKMSSSGYFSLVLGVVDGNWRILHDHTSTSPATSEAGG